MQKDSRFFSFLFKSSSKNRIYVRRVLVPKGIVQNGLLIISFVFIISVFSLGVVGVSNFSIPSFAEMAGNAVQNNQTISKVEISALPRSIDYSRPDGAADMALNSGGPYSPEQLVSDDPEVEDRLRLIQVTSDPMTIPNIWAVTGKINNEFGFRRNPFGGRTYEFHNGMDIDGERGDQIVAPASGTVTKSGWQGGYGNMVEIDHGNGLFTRYGHMAKVEVEVGDRVSRGVLIGYVGSTGRSTGPHLHYELRLGDRPINPRRFLPPEPTDISRASR